MAASAAGGVAVQVIAAVTLTIFATSQSVLVEMAKMINGGRVTFHTPSAVLYTELLKLVVSLSVFSYQRWVTGSVPPARITWSSLTYAVPAALFILQNNLTFIAMSLLDPPTFQLWACFKIIPAGIFARVLLGQRRSSVQWVALLLLVLGMATTKLDASPTVTQASGNTIKGILVLILNGWSSGASGVCNEWLIKYQDPQMAFMLKNAHIYVFGALVACTAAKSPWNGGLDGFGPMAVAIVVLNAVTGLSISFVLKLCDNLVKSFSTSAAVLLSAALATACCGFEASRAFVIGFGVVSCAFFFYFGEHNKVLMAEKAQEPEAAPVPARHGDQSFGSEMPEEAKQLLLEEGQSSGPPSDVEVKAPR